jgi:hypothetical protein
MWTAGCSDTPLPLAMLTLLGEGQTEDFKKGFSVLRDIENTS